MLRRARPWLGTIVEIAGDNLIAVEAGFAAIAHAHARLWRVARAFDSVEAK